MEIEIGSRLLAGILVVVTGVLVDRWWNYAARRR